MHNIIKSIINIDDIIKSTGSIDDIIYIISIK